MIYAISGISPQFDSSNFIAQSADLIGQVVLKENASVWFQCVIRADNDAIVIGKNTNIQDGSVLHVDEGKPINVGENVTVGHKVILHGCDIGDNTLIGMNAVVLNGAKIGKNCIIGANTLITENTVIPDGMLVLGSPGKVIKPIHEAGQKLLKKGASHYVENGKKYMESLTKISE